MERGGIPFGVGAVEPGTWIIRNAATLSDFCTIRVVLLRPAAWPHQLLLHLSHQLPDLSICNVASG